MLQVLLWEPGSRHVTVVLSICALLVFCNEYSRVWIFDTSCAWCNRTCCMLSFWEKQLSWVFDFCSPLERQYFYSRWHCAGCNVTIAHWVQMQHSHLQALGNFFPTSTMLSDHATLNCAHCRACNDVCMPFLICFGLLSPHQSVMDFKEHSSKVWNTAVCLVFAEASDSAC